MFTTILRIPAKSSKVEIVNMATPQVRDCMLPIDCEGRHLLCLRDIMVPATDDHPEYYIRIATRSVGTVVSLVVEYRHYVHHRGIDIQRVIGRSCSHSANVYIMLYNQVSNQLDSITPNHPIHLRFSARYSEVSIEYLRALGGLIAPPKLHAPLAAEIPALHVGVQLEHSDADSDSDDSSDVDN